MPLLFKKDKGGGVMERLTNRIFVPKEERELVVFTQGKYIDTIPAEMTHEDIRKVLRRLAEYEEAEEQGLMLRLPCKVGGTVYCIYERYTKCSENEQEFDEYSCQGCECLECDSHKELYVQSQKAYSLDWIVSNLKRFGKTIFLTKEEAEQKFREMESD